MLAWNLLYEFHAFTETRGDSTAPRDSGAAGAQGAARAQADKHSEAWTILREMQQ